MAIFDFLKGKKQGQSAEQAAPIKESAAAPQAASAEVKPAAQKSTDKKNNVCEFC